MMVKEGIEGVHIKCVQFENGEGGEDKSGLVKGKKGLRRKSTMS